MKTHLNLLTHTLVAVGELGRILAVLKEKLCIPNQETTVPVQQDSIQDQQLGLPQEAWPELCTAVQDSGDAELIRQLEVRVCNTGGGEGGGGEGGGGKGGLYSASNSGIAG